VVKKLTLSVDDVADILIMHNIKNVHLADLVQLKRSEDILGKIKDFLAHSKVLI
jgi:hypothetical protein